MNWGTICTPLEMIARDWKKRKIQYWNTEWIFRLIQSIPSKKARIETEKEIGKKVSSKKNFLGNWDEKKLN
jgi:hypothetical protein